MLWRSAYAIASSLVAKLQVHLGLRAAAAEPAHQRILPLLPAGGPTPAPIAWCRRCRTTWRFSAAGRCGRALDMGGPPYGRGERIRTSGPLLPKQVLYQAELRPGPGKLLGRDKVQVQRSHALPAGPLDWTAGGSRRASHALYASSARRTAPIQHEGHQGARMTRRKRRSRGKAALSSSCPSVFFVPFVFKGPFAATQLSVVAPARGGAFLAFRGPVCASST